jgi:hypothetical protein
MKEDNEVWYCSRCDELRRLPECIDCQNLVNPGRLIKINGYESESRATSNKTIRRGFEIYDRYLGLPESPGTPKLVQLVPPTTKETSIDIGLSISGKQTKPKRAKPVH